MSARDAEPTNTTSFEESELSRADGGGGGRGGSFRDAQNDCVRVLSLHNIPSETLVLVLSPAAPEHPSPLFSLSVERERKKAD